jgi:2-methylcitrate dehydratase
MDENSHEAPDNGRRRFMTTVAAAGAVAGAGGALPAAAQNKKVDPKSTLAPGQTPLAETFAAYAVNLKYEDIPPDVVRFTKRTILDTIGCAIGGQTSGPAQIALKLASGESAKQSASVLCSGIKTTPELAVFANGVMIRYLDFNDGYISLGTGHPSDLLAGMLTAAELGGRNGRELIAGFVAAYQVYTRIADALDARDLGLDQSTITAPSATAGIGRLMGLSREQLTHAISIAVGGNTSLNQGRTGTLSNWKAYAVAEASRKAMFCVQLAQAGMTGPEQVYEGRNGFFNVITHKPLTVAKPEGEPFGIMHSFTKRFPLGQYSQTVVQAAVEARQYFKDAAEIQEVNLRVARRAIRVMADSPDKWRPTTHETADHSMPYSAGVALMYGKVSDEYYENPYLSDAKLLDLVSKVKCIPSDEADKVEKEYNLCDLELVLKSGQKKIVRVDYHRGHWKNPMSDAEMEEKFRGLASRHLSTQRTDALLKQLWALENVTNVGELVAMTRA